MFRGKESSNRIVLSRLVQDLLNFGVSGSLQLWGWGGGCMGVGVVGGVPHTCAHACACTHTHTRMVNMIISCKWLPPLGEYLGITYDVICVCVRICACACMCTWVGCTLSPSPTPSTHPHPPGGDPWNQSKFKST